MTIQDFIEKKVKEWQILCSDHEFDYVHDGAKFLTISLSELADMQMPDQTICDSEDCEWKRTIHSKSWHWLTKPKDYYPNGDKKPVIMFEQSNPSQQNTVYVRTIPCQIHQCLNCARRWKEPEKVPDSLPLKSDKIWQELRDILHKKTNYYTAIHHTNCDIFASKNLVLGKCTCERDLLIKEDIEQLKSFIQKHFVEKEKI